jgi:hypothetical protein
MNDRATKPNTDRANPKEPPRPTQGQARESQDVREEIDTKANTPLKETNPAAEAEEEERISARGRQTIPSAATTSSP